MCLLPFKISFKRDAVIWVKGIVQEVLGVVI